MIAPCALFSLAVIMQALAPVGPVTPVGAVMLQPVKVRRVPPEASPSLLVASGYSSQLLPEMLGASPQARLRLVLTVAVTVVLVSGGLLVDAEPGRPEPCAFSTCPARQRPRTRHRPAHLPGHHQHQHPRRPP